MKDLIYEKYTIPSNHSLVLTNRYEKGTMGQNEYWEYDEIDTNNNIVHSYKVSSCTALRGLSTTNSCERIR